MKLLYIDACARKNSRTRALADEIVEKWTGSIEKIQLYQEKIPLLDEQGIIERDAAARKMDETNPFVALAKTFQVADQIIIAAPFWDMGFPAILKSYIEAIMVTGITFTYTLEGFPKGLCNAKKLIYVTTSGGPIYPDFDFGYSYIKTLAQQMWGIQDCHCIKAEGLDIIGADVDKILEEAKTQL